MVLDTFLFNRKCPVRAGSGHIENSQVPCIFPLKSTLNAVRALRADTTPYYIYKKHFTRNITFTSALSALTLFNISRRLFLAVFTCPSKCPEPALTCPGSALNI